MVSELYLHLSLLNTIKEQVYGLTDVTSIQLLLYNCD